jgi:6-phosphogluconolactonase (cycloisomerase 2 family)
MKRWLFAATVLTLAVPAVAEAKRNVYVSGTASNTVAALDIAADGALAPALTPAIPQAGPVGIAITPDGRFAYVANLGAGTVSAFSVDGTGLLTPIGAPVDAGDVPSSVAVSPDGTKLFVSNFVSGDVSAYTIGASGSLTAVAGNDFDAGAGPGGIAVSVDGTHLYVANQGDSNISVFTIASDGVLTAGTPVSAGVNVNDVAVTPDGRYMYAVNSGANTISGYSLQSGGVPVALTDPSLPAFTAALPSSLTISPDGTRLYTADTDGSKITGYAITAEGGLTPVAASFDSPAGPVALSLTPDGKRLYVANADADDSVTDTDTVSGFNVAGDGTLAAITGSPFDSGVNKPFPFGLAVTPNQGPTATLTATAASAGNPTSLSGAGSTDPDGSVASYAWDFGDGTTATTDTPATQHTYAQPGSYTVTLTVTDNEGCSTALVFTGKTAYCNGTTAARVQQQVSVGTADTAGPVITLSGPKTQKLRRTIKLRVRCSEACLAVAKTILVVTPPKRSAAPRRARRFKLADTGGLLAAGQRATLKIKVGKRAIRAARAALSQDGRARARIRVVAFDAAGNKAATNRAITLN